jgi:hypothetical protein
VSRLSQRVHANATNLLFFRQANRVCPLCGWKGFQFMPSMPSPMLRFDARCPDCNSYERHRLAHLLLKDRLPARLGKVLHFAPEAPVQRWISGLADDYHTADLMDPRARHRIDIQAMPFEDASFDFIWCSHVLEHVPDDRKAMAEMKRVLRPGGLAVIQVPVWGAETDEEVLSTDEERIARYFQADHLRRYGEDVVERLRASGLAVEVRSVRELPLAIVVRHRLFDPAAGEVFIATRGPA